MNGRTAFPAVDLRFESADEGEVEDRMGAVFPRMRTTIEGRSSGTTARLREQMAGDERLALHRLHLTFRARAFGALDGKVVAGVRRSGVFAMQAGKAAIDTARPFVLPATAYTTVVERQDVEVVVLDADALTRAARALIDDPQHRLRFTGSAPVSDAAEHYWRSAQRHIADTLLDPLLRESPLILDGVFRFAVRTLLLTFPNTALTARTPNSLVTPHRSVDSATSYIEANAHQPIDLDDIAAAAEAAPQSLVRAFRQRHGLTPMQYLRDLRYQHVHHDLVDADPWSSTTVAGIAQRWGFAATGRFAAQYRQRYGETPSATLRR